MLVSVLFEYCGILANYKLQLKENSESCLEEKEYGVKDGKKKKNLLIS